MSLLSFVKTVPTLLGPARAGLATLGAAISRPQPAAAGKLLLPSGETAPLEKLPPTRRLLVLVPDGVLVESEVAQRAWALAAPRALPVAFVGLAPEAEHEPQVRRQLAGLAALTRDEGVGVTTRVARVRQWLPAVEANWQPGDLVVVFAGQVASAGWLGLGRQALDRALLQTLRVPVYVSGRLERRPGTAHSLARPLELALSLLLPLIFIGLFFLLQVGVERVTGGGAAATVLLSLSVVAEFGLLWLLEHFLGRF